MALSLAADVILVMVVVALLSTCCNRERRMRQIGASYTIRELRLVCHHDDADGEERPFVACSLPWAAKLRSNSVRITLSPEIEMQYCQLVAVVTSIIGSLSTKLAGAHIPQGDPSGLVRRC